MNRLYTKSNALQVAKATVGKVEEVSRPEAMFVVPILELWLSMNGRCVFTNRERWGARVEKSYPGMFQKYFDWFTFYYELDKPYAGEEILSLCVCLTLILSTDVQMDGLLMCRYYRPALSGGVLDQGRQATHGSGALPVPHKRKAAHPLQ